MNADFDHAVEVDSVDTEYRYIAKQRCGCGGALGHHGQGLFQKRGKSYDVLHTVCKACGEERDFTFDISSFYCNSIFDWNGRFG
ncbi:MAG: hypothetical protein QNJ98_12475 [Planctomycetota bacterium]|nr:hypothetical protein [Planctomycetota bacterium]